MAYVGRGLNQTGGQYRKLDDISSGFDGSETGFSLTVDNLEVTPTAQNLMISINGVIQDPGTAFTVVGSTITFTGAPASSSDFFGVVMGEASYIAYGTVGANEMGVSEGAVSASGGVVVDSSKNISGFTKVTSTSFSGIFEGALSSSAQIATNISGSFTDASSSFSTRVTRNEASASSLISDSGSFSTRVTRNEASASSLTTASSSFSTRMDNSEASGALLNQDLKTSASPTFTGGTYTSNLGVSGSLTVKGMVTAEEFHTEFVSASIVYKSGSTKFGDDIDDTHSFTGSINQSGSFNLNDGNMTITDTLTATTLTGTTIKDFSTISGSSTSTGSFGDGRFAGKVGIGTTAPASLFHVSSPSAAFIASTWQSTEGSNVKRWDWWINDKRLLLQDQTNGEYRLAILDNGNVGIGTTSPTETLHVEGSASFAGNYIVNEQGRQDHVANTMPAPYYRFDGVDDDILIDHSDSMDVGNGDMSIHANIIVNSYATYGRIASKNNQYSIAVSTAGKIGFSIPNVSAATVDTTVLIVGKVYDIVVTWDNATVTYYINGVLSSSTAYSDSANAGTNDKFEIGSGDEGVEKFFNGTINKVSVWNKVLSATEIKELYSGASVPYKYKGANQTDLVTNGDMSSATNWTEWGDNVTIGSATCSFDSSGGSARLSQTIGAVVAGKRYRLDYEVTAVGGAASFIVEDGNITTASVGLNASVGVHTVEFTSSTTSANPTRLMFRLTGGDATLSLDNVVLTQIGAVAEYDGSGIASDKWFDKSGNDLHGTITAGATAPTVENAPSGDDGLVYEEGTWTVTAEGSGSPGGNFVLSGTEEVCSYTRIGRTVHCQGAIQINSDNSADGDIRFSLPFTNANLTQLGGRAYGTAFLLNAGSTLAGKIVVHAGEGHAYFTLIHISDDGTSYPNLTDAELDGNWFLGFQITFTVE